MVGAQFCVRTFPVFGGRTYQPNVGRQIRSSLNYSSSSAAASSLLFSFQLGHWKSRRSQIVISCNSSRSSGDKSNSTGEPDHDYLEAFVLLSETIRHYRMHMQGFQEEIKWPSSTQVFPSFPQAKDLRSDVDSVGPAFLRHFQSPTIFLKISCDGEFLLPIIVGEFAVERLIDSMSEEETWDCCPNQFQLARNLAETLGYKEPVLTEDLKTWDEEIEKNQNRCNCVTMVKITERVVNTYFARIFFCKPGGKDILSVDARPSDAINVAKRCRVPIYVHKQIVLTDGIRIGYGMGRKSFYDVSLDSAADGPDIIAEELDLLRNMNLAVKEERYSDAAIWRDKLIRLRESRRDF